MLNNLANDLPILNIAPQLLWQRIFNIIILGRQVDVHTRALACEDLCGQGVLGQVHCCAIDLV